MTLLSIYKHTTALTTLASSVMVETTQLEVVMLGHCYSGCCGEEGRRAGRRGREEGKKEGREERRKEGRRKEGRRKEGREERRKEGSGRTQLLLIMTATVCSNLAHRVCKLVSPLNDPLKS